MNNDNKKYGVYFANLEAYNEGRMVGGWVYPLEYKSFKDFVKAIKTVTNYADEIAVHDYDNFPNMGEYPVRASIYKLAHSLRDSSLKDEVSIKYFNNHYSGDYEDLIDEIDSIENAYVGEYDYLKDFIEEQADEEIYNLIPEDAQRFVFNNFDYEGYGKDLLYSYNVVTLDNHNVVIFNQG